MAGSSLKASVYALFIKKMEGGMTFCNMVIEADEKNGAVPAYEFPFNYLEDMTSVEYEPAYSDKDDRLIAVVWGSSKFGNLLWLSNVACKTISPTVTDGKRFIQDYRFDVSKLEPSAAKGKKVEVPTYLVQATHKAWMDIDIASKSQDQVERLVPRSLRKLAVILLPILVVFLAWVVLETLTLTIVHIRYVPLSQTGIFLTGWATEKHRSIHLT